MYVNENLWFFGYFLNLRKLEAASFPFVIFRQINSRNGYVLEEAKAAEKYFEAV